jgi:hypothetical protein
MPFYRFHIDSSLPVDIAAARIASLTRPSRSWEWIRITFERDRPQAAFVGRVEGRRFSMRRDIRYRNSFLPMIWGRIESMPGGSRTTIMMTLHPLVIIFLLVWLAGVGSAAVATLAEPAGGVANAAVPLGMFVFAIALTLIGFIPEAWTAKRLIRECLRGKGQRS